MQPGESLLVSCREREMCMGNSACGISSDGLVVLHLYGTRMESAGTHFEGGNFGQKIEDGAEIEVDRSKVQKRCTRD